MPVEIEGQARASECRDFARTQATQAQAAREAQDLALKRFSDTMTEQLRVLSDANERRLGEVRSVVEQRLQTELTASV